LLAITVYIGQTLSSVVYVTHACSSIDGLSQTTGVHSDC